jgi:hypothetical protein
LLTGVDSLKLDLSECLRVRIQPRLSKESSDSDSDCDNKLSKENEGDCVNKLGKESDSDRVNKLSKENDGDCVNKLSKESDGDCVNKLSKEIDGDCVNKLSKESDGDCDNNLLESSPNEGCQSGKFRRECKRKYVDDHDTPSMPEFPHTANGEPSLDKMWKSDGPSMMPLLSIPDIDNYVQNYSVVLTGTANRGLLGPSVGVVDIGISKVAYLFRVLVPGVKREHSMFLFFLCTQVYSSRFFLLLLLSLIVCCGNGSSCIIAIEAMLLFFYPYILVKSHEYLLTKYL